MVSVPHTLNSQICQWFDPGGGARAIFVQVPAAGVAKSDPIFKEFCLKIDPIFKDFS